MFGFGFITQYNSSDHFSLMHLISTQLTCNVGHRLSLRLSMVLEFSNATLMFSMCRKAFKKILKRSHMSHTTDTPDTIVFAFHLMLICNL